MCGFVSQSKLSVCLQMLYVCRWPLGRGSRMQARLASQMPGARCPGGNADRRRQNLPRVLTWRFCGNGKHMTLRMSFRQAQPQGRLRKPCEGHTVSVVDRRVYILFGKHEDDHGNPVCMSCCKHSRCFFVALFIIMCSLRLCRSFTAGA